MSQTEEDLCSQLAAALAGRVDDPAALSEAVLQAFAVFTPPRIEGAPTGRADYIKALDPTAGGISIKPGNIRLNWRKLFAKAPELVLTGAGVTQPWLIPFAALYAWNLVWSLSKIEITPAQAMTMHALWNAREGPRRFSEPDARSIVNAFRHACGEPSQSEAEFAKVVDDLVALSCIELEDGIIWLREWVKKMN